MWYRLEYKKSAKARKWHFIMLCGDKSYLDELCEDYNKRGTIARVVMNEG